MAIIGRRFVHVISLATIAAGCGDSGSGTPGPGSGGSGVGVSGSAGTTAAGSTSGGSVATGGAGAVAGAGTGGAASGGSNVGGASGGTGGASNGGAGGQSGTATGGMSGGGAGGTSGGIGGSTNGGGGSASGGGGNANGGGGSGGTANGGGGTGGTSGACSRPVGSCTAPTVNVTNVSLGVAVTAYGSQNDTAPLPMAIASIPSGGSRLAWLGTDKKVYIGKLSCDDQLVGSPFSIPAEDLQDVYADETGGVVMVTRNATSSGTDNCGSGMLCGGTSAQCQQTYLVRFNDAGQVQWETPVTNLSASRAGYDNGAIFTWKQYQHHGRIAFDGANYAAYFAAAITVYKTGNSGCVDIHEGDRMQVVDGAGKLLTGHNSFDWGCSHSWTTRVAYDPTNKAFVMTCATDANNCAIKRPDTGALLFQATCSGQFFNGDLINASGGGFWSAWSDTNAIRLNQFAFNNTKGASVANAGSSQHPHLVTYGPGKMLLAFASGSTSMAAQVRDMSTGASIGSALSISVKDHAFQAFKPYADGSAAYPAAGDNTTSAKIARVLPCQ